MVKILKTDSYYNMFSVLAEDLVKQGRKTEDKILIFCEDKISLMTEKTVCDKLGGTFNIGVYSFAGYLAKKKGEQTVLSKEGSAMVIKKILASLPLKLFHSGKANLAPSLYELIIQLKSAKVKPCDIKFAAENASGSLQNKLYDIGEVFEAYENFLEENGFEDQNSVLKYLPEIIRQDPDLTNARVYIFGYSSFTAQMREIIEILIKRTKEAVAILPYGKNEFVFLNECCTAIASIAEKLNVPYEENFIPTNYSVVSKKLIDELFSPLSINETKVKGEQVALTVFPNTYAEIERIGEEIKEKVLQGYRYKDFKIALPQEQGYREEIHKIFSLMDIPYFLDDKRRGDNNPVITLVLSYAEVFRKNSERGVLSEFYKNPLVCEDKNFTDRFENYILSRNVNYGKIKMPFTEEDGEEVKEFENFRRKIVSVFDEFNVEKMLETFSVKEKTEEFVKKLAEEGEREESAVTAQIYAYAEKLLKETALLEKGERFSPTEFKSIFKSGVEALEISIIPQYNDAVFVGDYKEVALSNAEFLFAVGLTSDVPAVQEDIALLSDEDIDALSSLKVLVEPKIQVVNKRLKERTVLALASFNKKLYLSFPSSDYSGNKNIKSEIFDYAENAFDAEKLSATNGYRSVKQGLRNFARDCGLFSECLIDDFRLPSAYYRASGEKKADKVLSYSDKEMNFNLVNSTVLVKDVTSPTAIEDYQKCPYKYFIEKGLKVREREKGEMNGLSVGNIMHEIFCAFVKRLPEINKDEEVNRIFKEEASKIIEKKQYKVFGEDPIERAKLYSTLKECEKFCRHTYEWSCNSDFKTQKNGTEVKFGGDGTPPNVYPAVSLSGGKVKISGTIDRIDEYKDYCRIIDYKTGSVSDENSYLYTGTKLQLYLYASAVKDKKIAGVYYMPIKDEYTSAEKKEQTLAIGKTLASEEILFAQDKNLKESSQSAYIPVTKSGAEEKGTASEEIIRAFIDYAVKVSERATENMESGFIAPTPYDKVCNYCAYKSMCGMCFDSRKCNSVKDEEIASAVQDTDEAEKYKDEG